jgi:hypothetical protein
MLGLTGLADFPSMVAVLVAAYFSLRAFLDNDDVSALAAGVAFGAAIAVKPANSAFVVGSALALLVSRRWRVGALAALSTVPALLVLAFWKERGLGHVPLLSSEPAHRLALGPGPVASPFGHYLHINWHRLDQNRQELREFFWSERLLEWLPVAGAIGLARRSGVAAALLAGWLASFLFIKGSYAGASFQDATLMRLLMPAFPAFVLLVAAVPLLVPGLAARLRPAAPEQRLPRSARLELVVMATVATALLPAVAIAGAQPARAPHTRVLGITQLPTPSESLGLRSRKLGSNVIITWHRPRTAGTKVIFLILRTPAQPRPHDINLMPAGKGFVQCVNAIGVNGTCWGDGITCTLPGSGAETCYLSYERVGATDQPVFEETPPPGSWIYRVAVNANWINSPRYGDVFALSEPLRVRMP